MKNFKKVIAALTTITLIAVSASSLVNAAAVNDSTAVVTVGTDIVVNSATGGFGVSGTDTCIATITRTNTDNTTTAITVDSCTVTNDNNLTIGATTVAANEYYTIAFTTSQDVFGTTNVGDTTNTVSVTAYVLPILTMNLDTPTVTFGELIPGTPNTQSIVVTTASNAKNGITINTTSVGLATGDTATDKYVGTLGRVAALATTGVDTYVLESVDTSTTGGTILASQDVTGSQDVLVTDDVTKSNAITTVNLTATVDVLTEAGNYNDTLVFTVTGNY